MDTVEMDRSPYLSMEIQMNGLMVFIEGVGEAKVSATPVAAKRIPSLGLLLCRTLFIQVPLWSFGMRLLVFFSKGRVEQRAVLSCGQKGDQRRPKMTEGQIFLAVMDMGCASFEGKDERLGCKQSCRQDAEW